jgi:hypothetical protein
MLVQGEEINALRMRVADLEEAAAEFKVRARTATPSS